ncbi:PaaI family thioesterase [Aspergillus fijiensis CBS 313.89]|uniref:Thioesterase family protein n=1 Tax=Aspergillus fijiensis CBS 313.89 TaxID=1448319 RepID=A0A8G1VTQ4_9EURO|nr:thioesterase family protein [Aspergillus fijiensis CBS 313.89]RAK72332.1 thioesterase family protein [Aspergillus fijiensis CBS 313.89]
MPVPTTRAYNELDEFERHVHSLTEGPPPLDPDNKLHGSRSQVLCITNDLALNKTWDYSPQACNLRFESATRGAGAGAPARCSYLFTTVPALCNFAGNLHGGAAATMVDCLTSVLILALSSPGRFSTAGTTRNLHLTYIRPVPVGTEMRLNCEMVNMGQRMALVKAEICRAEDSKPYVFNSQNDNSYSQSGVVLCTCELG